MYLADFFRFLTTKVKGRRVLDCGAAGEEGIGTDSPFWVHKFIVENASYTLGFDLGEESVKELKQKGYNFVHGDCEKLELEGVDEKFDVVFGGEIIEHLSTPGSFLEGVKKYLEDGGQLILTTPNAFSLFRFMGNAAGANKENPQHVLVQNADTLVQLLERHGYEVKETHFFVNPSFFEHRRLRTVRQIGKMVLSPLFRMRPQLGHQILIIANKKG